MERMMEVNVNFCVKLQNSPNETLEMLTVTVNPQAKEATDVKVKIKTMLKCFCDMRGNIHFESVPEGTTVNQTFYVEVLKRLIGAMRRKRGGLWRDRSLILHHDTAPAQSALRVS
jgi:hypothetical protein